MVHTRCVLQLQLGKIKVQLFLIYPCCFWMTYMAVEQAAFVTCNSFRLLEVFNRHVKLKEEEACRKERKQVDKQEQNRETLQRMKIGRV